MSTFKQVDPERISFIGRPKFKAEEFLDPVGKRGFLHPLQCRADPDKFTGDIPKVKVHCSLSQKVRLFKLLDDFAVALSEADVVPHGCYLWKLQR